MTSIMVMAFYLAVGLGVLVGVGVMVRWFSGKLDRLAEDYKHLDELTEPHDAGLWGSWKDRPEGEW